MSAGPSEYDELPPPPSAPWATMITALLILFVFLALGAGVLFYARSVTDGTSTMTGEQQLKELRAQQRDILDNYGYDPATKTWRVPIDRSMSVLVEEAKSKGQFETLPSVKPAVSAAK